LAVPAEGGNSPVRIELKNKKNMFQKMMENGHFFAKKESVTPVPLNCTIYRILHHLNHATIPSKPHTPYKPHKLFQQPKPSRPHIPFEPNKPRSLGEF
jgi:hypothetical protein